MSGDEGGEGTDEAGIDADSFSGLIEDARLLRGGEDGADF